MKNYFIARARKNRVNIKTKLFLICIYCVLLFSVGNASAAVKYLPAGNLISGSGTGQTVSPLYLNPYFEYNACDWRGCGWKVYDFFGYVGIMRLPVEQAATYANSQVYNSGGFLGSGPDQCDPKNYNFPWQDNFCETRSNPNSKSTHCPTKTRVHTGQDMRPATCKKDTYWAVSAEPGYIDRVGLFSLQIQGDSGFRHHYLHLDKNSYNNWKTLLNQNPAGVRVSRGQRLGLISNTFGGTPTTIHLHYELRDTSNEALSPYNTLVETHKVAELCDTNPSFIKCQ